MLRWTEPSCRSVMSKWHLSFRIHNMLISLLRILHCSQPDIICLLVVAFCSQKFLVLFVAEEGCAWRFGYILCCITVSTPSFWVPPALRPSRVSWEAGDSYGLFRLLTTLPHPPSLDYSTPFLWAIVPLFPLIIILVGLLPYPTPGCNNGHVTHWRPTRALFEIHLGMERSPLCVWT